MILRKVVEYYVFFICAKSRHCSWKSTRDIFVYVCFSVFVHVNCATDQYFPMGKQICSTIVWGCAEILPTYLFLSAVLLKMPLS